MGRLMRVQAHRELACQLSGSAIKRRRGVLPGIGFRGFFSFLDHGGIFIGNSIQLVNGFLCKHRRRNYYPACEKLPSRFRLANSCLGRNLAQILRIVLDIAGFDRRYMLEWASTVG